MPEINQQTIADRLGLSRATVSRCFTNHAGISPVTRAKVFQTAAEIGYTHMETRTPSAKRTKKKVRFNVLICSDTDEYFRGGYESPGEQILAGVSEYAQSHGARVDVNLIPPDVKDLDDPAFLKVEGLVKREASGILLIYPFPEPVIDQLALRFPLVSLVDQLEHNSIDCVDVDHYYGISSVIDHLIEAGHQRIGFYTKTYQVEASWSYRRYSAFMEKMARLKLKVSAKDVIGMFPRESVSLPASISEAAERTRQGVTAWVCAADHQAYDLIRGFKKEGLAVPKDVSVTGFDGIERVGSGPSLTTVQIPFREIGMTGAERLAARLRKRFHGKQHIYISGKLRSGKTVAPPLG
ncbi:LacI family DNA-binding transcriptional regulator [Haloferula sp.]|uniref:LacI family DNA-binding transcriptional regulator n=1 Tax=Haloferula sp. TaxID=2497595 RepID=UPI003C77A952